MKKQILLSIAMCLVIYISRHTNLYAQAWDVNGNPGILPTNFLGTVAPEDLIIKTNSIERMRFDGGPEGFIGINNTTPIFPLDMSNINYMRSFNLNHSLATVNLNAGFYATTSNTGTGATYSYFSDIPATSTGTGFQASYYGSVAGSGNGSHFGLNVSMGGTGTGTQYGTYSSISNTGSGTKYASYATITGSGSGTKYGSFASITNSSGTQYGFYSTLSGSGNSPHYGAYQLMGGTGAGPQYGSYSSVTNTGSGTHYGLYSTLSGTGNGNQYGLYSTIPNTGSGTHYGIYSSASGNTNYAFYGLGRGYFSENVGIGIASPHSLLQIADNEVDLTSGGSLIIGTTTDNNIAMDANEIHARNNSTPSPLYLNGYGEAVIINNQGDVNEASLANQGAFRIGSTSSTNLIMDNDEIQVRSNGSPETLFLNPEGGHVAIGYDYIGGCAGDCPKLSVCGRIQATEVRIESGWCDYVFDEKYELQPLEEVASYISENNHLPGVPSADEIATQGLDLGNASEFMMEKIEELTLYLIDQNEALKILQEENAKMKLQLATMLDE